MGTWALFLIITTIFETTKSALLKGAHIKFVSSTDNHTEKILIGSSSLLVNSLISLVFISCLLLLSEHLNIWFHTGPELSQMLELFIPGLIFMVFFSHLEATQQSHFDFKGVFAGYFSRQLIFFFFILFDSIMRVPFSLQKLAIYQSISIAIGTLVIYLYTKKYLSHKFSYSNTGVRKLLAFGGYIFGSGVVSNIFANLDQLITGAFLSPVSVAYYNTAARLNQFIDIPSYSASEILFPKVSRASSVEGTGKVKYLFEKMLAILLSFAIPISLFIIIFPKFVITLIAGPAYVAAAPILQLNMLTAIFRPLQNQSANVLNSMGRAGLCFAINLAFLCSNLVLDYLCLLYFGFYGAAIGSFITITASSVLWYFVMRKQVGLDIRSLSSYIRQFYKNLPSMTSDFLGNRKA